MKNAVQTTIDSAGRLVLPKAVRDEAGILPGITLKVTIQGGRIEIEPVPREVRIVQRGPLRIAVPVEEGPPLAEETVQQARREIREYDGEPKVECTIPLTAERRAPAEASPRGRPPARRRGP